MSPVKVEKESSVSEDPDVSSQSVDADSSRASNGDPEHASNGEPEPYFEPVVQLPEVTVRTYEEVSFTDNSNRGN